METPEAISNLMINSDNTIALLPHTKYTYNGKYLQHYQELAKSGLAQKLSQLRMDYINRFIAYDQIIVDIGCCAGTFIDERNKIFKGSAMGFDVIPAVEQRLKTDGLWHDVRVDACDYATMWDVIEHEYNPTLYLSNIKKGVFISTPVYDDIRAIDKSKHFKPGEHVWYFTEAGLCQFMGIQGFMLADRSDFEIKFGRESVMSYYFERVH